MPSKESYYSVKRDLKCEKRPVSRDTSRTLSYAALVYMFLVGVKRDLLSAKRYPSSVKETLVYMLYIHACESVCVCVYTYKYIYIYTHTHKCMYTHTHMNSGNARCAVKARRGVTVSVSVQVLDSPHLHVHRG